MNNPRILVIRGGAIGDFVMTLPAIGALRERWPEAHIEILGYTHIVELAAGRHYAQKTRSIEYGPLSGFFVENGTLDRDLAEYFADFNLITSYLYDPDRIFLSNLERVGAKHIVSGSSKPEKMHAAEHFARPLESLAIYVESPRPKVYPSEEDLEFGQKFWKGSEGLRCAVHCGSGSPSKNWPVASFVKVCDWLLRTRKCALAIISGESDDHATKDFLEAMRFHQPKLAVDLRLVELAGVLASSGLYLGNDSGVTHLAAAVGAPVVAFWSGYSVPQWQPRGEQVRVINFREAAMDRITREIEALLAQCGEKSTNSL